MKSATALTYEMDDMKLAAKQLADQVKSKLTLTPKSFGVIFADSELDHKELMSALDEELAIPIMGCTTIAIIDGKEGFCEMCTSLVVISGDDYSFSIIRSEPITADNAQDVICQTYRQGAESLGEDVKMVFVLPPYNLDIMLDEYPETLMKAAEGRPVYGGLASYNETGDTIANIDNQGVYDDRMLLLTMGGNIKPLFSVSSAAANCTKKKEVVTKSDKNIVYTIGDKTFLDYCDSLGISMLKLSNAETLPYVSTPMVVETVEEDADGVSVIRAIHAVNKKDGSCTAICKVPQNSLISIASLKKSDMESSAMQALESLLSQMEDNSKDGYEYSTIFCVSCVGRFLVMVPENDAEGKMITRMVPENIQVAGFYGYGEIGPTSIRNGKAMNRAHNHSIVMMAL